jgi:hypothetical protein
VTPAGVTVGEYPALPLLATVPGSGAVPSLTMAVFAVPIAAGVAAGLLLTRSGARILPWWQRVSRALGAGAFTGTAVAVLTALAGGPLAGGRMATLGPSAWRCGLAAAVEVGLVAMVVTAAVLLYERWRRTSRADA